MIHKSVLNVALPVVLLAGGAWAADATAAESADFSGFYVGGSVGYSWLPGNSDESIRFDTNGDGAFVDTVRTGAGADAFSPGFCAGFANNNLPAGGCREDKDGVTWALHAGWDWQRDNLVFGAVIEGGKTRGEDAVSAYSTTPASYVMSREIDTSGQLRGRAGYVFGSTLVYLTGGLAYATFENRFATSNAANAFTANGNDDAFGWVGGIGVEQQVTSRISLGLLARYSRFKNDGYTVNAARGAAPANNPFAIAPAGSVNFDRSEHNFENTTVVLTASYRVPAMR